MNMKKKNFQNYKNSQIERKKDTNMPQKDEKINISIQNISNDYDFDEPSWSRNVNYKELEKIITNEVPNFDFDESSWGTEIKK